MRRPAVAGQFYPARKKDLVEIVETSYVDVLGPGKSPPKKVGKSSGKIKGMVVPHAGLVFSGPCAAHTYLALAKNGFPETLIIIGPNHSGIGSSVALTTEDWEMPFGSVKIDKALAKKMTKGVVRNDPMSHSYEHSVEVQLPFLQRLRKDMKFVPIVMGQQDYSTSKELGNIMAEAIKGKDVLVIAASDFSHVGMNFSIPIPKGMDAGQYAKQLDEMAIEKILEMDPKGLIKTVKENRITMCGYGTVAATIIAAKSMGAKKARLLKYYSSHDVMPGYSAVGYGAIVFE
jgi:AmmeMemoRadiSam system protein B